MGHCNIPNLDEEDVVPERGVEEGNVQEQCDNENAGIRPHFPRKEPTGWQDWIDRPMPQSPIFYHLPMVGPSRVNQWIIVLAAAAHPQPPTHPPFHLQRLPTIRVQLRILYRAGNIGDLLSLGLQVPIRPFYDRQRQIVQNNCRQPTRTVRKRIPISSFSTPHGQSTTVTPRLLINIRTAPYLINM